MGVLVKLWAFIKRDFQSEVSYRLAFVLQVGGMFLSLLAFFYMTGLINPADEKITRDVGVGETSIASSVPSNCSSRIFCENENNAAEK